MIKTEKLNIPGTLPDKANRLPRFKSVNREHPVKGDGSFRDEDRIHLGYETGFRVLPYLMQDSYSREKEDLELDTVILENE
ncbi:MAG: hypothetical protein PQJ58_14290, partial [Spirochaetales bacterium]|nr:hypothetical protein [Spirochaetales bacterium]